MFWGFVVSILLLKGLCGQIYKKVAYLVLHFAPLGVLYVNEQLRGLAQQTQYTNTSHRIMKEREFNQTIIPLGDKMYRFALSIVGCGPEAQDVVQDVMERLWRGRADLQPANLEAFVMRSVRNAALDKVEGARRRAERLEDVAYLSSRATAPRDEFDVGELVERFVAELPERQQTILHLRDVEGYDFDTIAEVVGMESATVRVNLSRARREIKEKMERVMNFGL